MGITPPLARIISRRSGIQRSMLLMAARTGTMWLNATLCAIYMSEHCMRGWTTLLDFLVLRPCCIFVYGKNKIRTYR